MKVAFSSVLIFLGLWMLSEVSEAREAVTERKWSSNLKPARYRKRSTESSYTARRLRRSIMEMNDMVKEVIGRSGMDFVGYGNWCGPGGGGQPVDPIDTCCAIHDFCYNKLLVHKTCPNGENGILYNTSYEWSTEEQGDKKKIAKCGKNSGPCKKSVCHCDTNLVNCLQENMDSYREENRHNINLESLLDMVFNNGK